MNTTEEFLIQMGLTYAQMTLQTNTKLTADQKAALSNFITAGAQVTQSFAAA